MYGTPGYATYINLATKAGLSTNLPIRGMYEFQGILLIVSGNKLYRYDDQTTTAYELGALQSTTGPVTIRDNGNKVLGIGGNQVLITDGKSAYIWTYNGSSLLGTFAELTAYTLKSYTKKAVSYTNYAPTYSSGNKILVNDSSANLSKYTAANGGGNKIILFDNNMNGYYYVTSGSFSSDLNCIVLVIARLNSTDPILPNLAIWNSLVVDCISPSLVYQPPAPRRYDCISNIMVSGDVTSQIYAGDRIQLTNSSGNVTYTGSATYSNYKSSISATMIGVSGTPTLGSLMKWNGLYFGDLLVNGDTTADYNVGDKIKVTKSDGTVLYDDAITSKAYRSALSATIIGTGDPYDVSNLADWTNIYLSTSYLPTTGLSHCEYIDGYFVAAGTGSMNAYASNLYDGTTWGALAFSPIQATNDPIQTVVPLHEQLWHIKKFSSEIFYNAGTPTSEGYPFSRISGGVIDIGTDAPYSVVKCDSSLIFLGTQRVNETAEFYGIVQLSGTTPEIISTPAINYQISQISTRSDAIAFAYKLNSHTFYVLTFPTGNRTFVYDTTTQMWHEWSSYQTPYSIRRHVANCYCYHNGIHLIGDSESSNIYQLSESYYTDNGNPIVSERIAPVIYEPDDYGRLFLSKIIVDAETGVGNSSDYDPECSLSWSDDYRTWSNEYPSSVGKKGEYYKQFIS